MSTSVLPIRSGLVAGTSMVANMVTSLAGGAGDANITRSRLHH